MTLFSIDDVACNGRMHMIHPLTADVDERVAGVLTEEPDERVLLQRLAQGDRAAFWEIWATYREQRFSNCLYWMDGSREDAEDALSSASLKAWVHMPAYAPKITHVKSWLMALLHNHCMDIRRALKRQDHNVQKLTALDRGSIGRHSLRGASPEELVSHQELLQDVRHAIDNLPPALHQMVELRFGRDMSYSEISAQFHLSPENARKRVQQARSILRASCVGHDLGVGMTDEASCRAKGIKKPKQSLRSTPSRRPGTDLAEAGHDRTRAKSMTWQGVVLHTR
jgi:RNA polymerase sigma factor (sigma-70 family)